MTSGVVRPPAVRPGDTVAVVSPSGPPRPDKIAAGVALLEGWGLRVKVSPHACDRVGYLAGHDQVRVDELNAALRDPQVRAVVCTRGGYGASRIIDQVDFDAVSRDPKPVTGYSDITALFNAIFVHSGVAGIHGPVLTTFSGDHDAETARSFHDALFSSAPITLAPRDGEESAALTRGDTAVSGPLLGGNLSLVVDAVGTASCPDYSGAILFCEEINEEPYRLDRIWTQLRRSGVLNEVAGFALGQFTSCVDTDWDWDVVDVLRDRLAEYDVPVLGGLPFGHGDNPRTVPFGTWATLDPAAGTLTAEAAVS